MRSQIVDNAAMPMYTKMYTMHAIIAAFGMMKIVRPKLKLVGQSVSMFHMDMIREVKSHCLQCITGIHKPPLLLYNLIMAILCSLRS